MYTHMERERGGERERQRIYLENNTFITDESRFSEAYLQMILCIHNLNGILSLSSRMYISSIYTILLLFNYILAKLMIVGNCNTMVNI